jgi:hypothetical protein
VNLSFSLLESLVVFSTVTFYFFPKLNHGINSPKY